MTTIVAVKKNGKICIGTDTGSLFGNRKELCPATVPTQHKLFFLDDTYFGTAGDCCWDLIVKNYYRNNKKKIDFSTAANTFESLCTLHKFLKSQYFLNSSNKELFESSECNLLCANKYGIFEIEGDRTVTSYSEYAAIGSGEKYALGALKSLYETSDNAEFITQSALTIAAKYDAKTFLPLQIFQLGAGPA